VLIEFLWQNEQNRRYGWNLRKRVKWHVERLWAKKQRQKLRHELKEELKAAECGEEVHRGEPEKGEIHGEDSNVGGDLMFETSNEAKKPYLFLDGLFMVADVIDDEQPFEVVMKREEDRGEHSSKYVLNREEEQYLNRMLIRNDRPKTEIVFGLHTNYVHASAAKVIINFQTDVSGIEIEGEQFTKFVVNENATKLKEEYFIGNMETKLNQ